MDSKKLARIIQLIVEQELKKQLPKLIKEGVASVLNENIKVVHKQQPILQDEELDMFSLAESVLQKERKGKVKPSEPKRTLSKNPIINEILNDTKPFKESSALGEDYRNMDKTLSLDSNGAQGGMDVIRAQMAAKMGYGDIKQGPSPGGLGVQTGVPVMDKVLNRDYSELVKRFKK